ncbi:MAG: chloramphenicol phosphotransferase CPT family protein [Alphaproteobacteria bacterium]|nr:chloramphenicol phosphotransferase CPT family protein [Alphaproteobacteria bacterium]
MTEYTKPKIIFLNGTSSAGKSSIARELRTLLPKDFCYFASDQLADAEFRALEKSDSERQRFFAGFHLSIAAFASCHNDMVVEHIVEEREWANDLKRMLAPFDTFWVGVHCDLERLRQREKLRVDRTLGEAEFHLKTHEHLTYDAEVTNITHPLDAAKEIHRLWLNRELT